MIRNAAAMPPCRVWPGSIGRRSRGEGERSPLLFPCARRGKEGGKIAPVSGRGKPPRGNAVSTCRMVSQRLRTNEVFLVDTREREEKRKRNTMTTTLQHLLLEKSLSPSLSLARFIYTLTASLFRYESEWEIRGKKNSLSIVILLFHLPGSPVLSF